jgi:hypothetical protein
MTRLFAVVALITLAMSAHAQRPSGPDVPPPTEIQVDWTQQQGEFNRALFSVQGFMQIYEQPDPYVMETFLLMNPMGTQTRMETWIDRMEPENDNDDPHVFNWDAFRPQQMVRFIDERDAFDAKLDELGMEKLSLLCYNVSWLRSGDKQQPVKDLEEWAEFAAAVVESYNGDPKSPDYKPNLQLVQIWNEPNMGQFWDGTDEAFFDLYNVAAKRIRENYPGVLVGGPTVTPGGGDIVEYMERFLAACGENVDFVIFHHYGPKGQGISPITDNIKLFAEMFRAIPGKGNGKVMITETDAWFNGWDKMDFMFERQFALIDMADLIAGIHHFCALYYNESGNYGFGMVDEKGGVVPGTFWPYWLFRNTIGQLAPVKMPSVTPLNVVATTHTNEKGAFLASAVLRNPTDDTLSIRTHLIFPPSNAARVLTVDHLKEDFQGISNVIPIRAGTTEYYADVTLDAHEAAALVLRTPGERHFAFSDLNNQETPWISLKSNKTELGLHETVLLSVEITNTLNRSLSGSIRFDGIPRGWGEEILSGLLQVENLDAGATQELFYEVIARNVPEDELVGIVAIFEETGVIGTGPVPAAHSIPATFNFQSPLLFQILPSPVYAVAGERNSVTLQIRNTMGTAIQGNFALDLTGPMDVALPIPLSFDQEGGSRARYDFPFTIEPDAQPGRLSGAITVEFLGATARIPFTVEVVEAPALGRQIPVDLTKHLNFDAVSFVDNREDYDKRMGMFIYPGDYTPSATEIRTKGHIFQMADLADGRNNVILPQGQRIELEPGKYTGVSMLGFGHDGKHPGTWTLHYADGTSQSIDSMIPEWCTPPPPGYEVAFTAPHRYVPHGMALPACELFFWTLPADPSRELVGVEFPEIVNGYVFAMTLQAPTE